MRPFEELVRENWTLAGMRACHEFSRYESSVMESLNSPDPEVRSAAIATLIDAEQAAARESVLPLLDDPARLVREEALEYLCDHALPEDGPKLYSLFKTDLDIFMISRALCMALGDKGPLLDSDDPEVTQEAGIRQWKEILENAG